MRRIRPPMRQFRLPRRRLGKGSRNTFVVVMIIIAIVAVLGALLVYFVFVKKPERQAVPPEPPPPPKPVEPFRPLPVEAWDKADDPAPRTKRPRTGGTAKPQTLGDSAVGAGIRRLASGFNRCGRDHGAVDGSVVRVTFSVSPSGSVTEVQSLAPHSRTPLGRCIANVLGGGSFGRSEEGRSNITWSITLHP